MSNKIDNSSKPRGTVWTKEQALSFIKEIRPEVEESGFDIALTGSLLTKDEASDLDLVIFPLNASKFDRSLLTDILEKHCRRWFSPGRLKRAWESLGSFDSKHAEKWKFEDGRLLDIFHLT